MKILKLSLYLLFFTSIMTTYSQDLDLEVKRINHKMDSIISHKQKILEEDLTKINSDLKAGKISREEAKALKKEVIINYADDLDYTIYKFTIELKKLTKNYKTSQAVDSLVKKQTAYHVRKIRMYRKKYYDTEEQKNKRTYAYFFIAGGFNNLMNNDDIYSLEYSNYKYLGSRFFEMGLNWKTELLRNKLFVSYGGSVIWNTLKPVDNKYHIIENGQIELDTFSHDLSTSKLRHIWLRVPLNLELFLFENFDVRVSAGGYAKIRLTTKQKLNYKQNGQEHDEVIKNNYTMPGMVFGLTGGIGGNDWLIYANYDITPLFKNTNRHLIELGIKWHL